jgi:hypothetical protein
VGFLVQPESSSSDNPTCVCWDRLQANLSSLIAIPGAGRVSSVLTTYGLRRWRMKMRINVPAGTASVEVIVQTQTFGRIFFVQTVFGPFGPFAGANPVVVQWGEGIAAAPLIQNDMGVFFTVGFNNLGPNNCQCTELEVWGGA